MSLISKISHLRKLPELLNQKEEAKKRSKKDKEEQEGQKEKPAFEIDDDVSIDPDKLSEYKVNHQKKPDTKRKAQTDDDNIGQNIDLTV